MAKKKVKRKRTPVVEAKVSRRPRKRMSRGAVLPWVLYSIVDTATGYLHRETAFTSKKKAQTYIDNHLQLTCPVIAHVDIPPVEY